MSQLFRLFTGAVFAWCLGVASVEAAEPGNALGRESALCQDANLFTNVFEGICWDCFLDNLSLLGIGNPPDGAAPKSPVCACDDRAGVPQLGWPLAMWQPQRVVEVTTIPWCSAGLGGIRLQDTFEGLGYSNEAPKSGSRETGGFYQYHYYSYPIMLMLQMFVLPECYSDYIDFDLLYLSEVDPLWHNDLLALLLNPEAVIFSNPIAMAYCAYDCVRATADAPIESAFPCAGCDGNLYPLTGHVNPQPDQVAATSLISQRALASLHRRGLAKKTMGKVAQCEPQWAPMMPRSQYRFSMLYPVPEASGQIAPDFISGTRDDGEVAQQAGSGQTIEPFTQCCHPMGMSTARWCVPAGGRKRPGKDTTFMYLIWNYRDCCVRNVPGTGD
ncbi:TraU family protein [Pseudoalteromonas rubra]|uniref:Plasmid transfer protein n=1 Tax=Pseudoalteromonas rubra TaxID=43658 RepID=A0A0U3GMJ5_9GAMM|nr:TraU family protein [Pseudoalteromonas rubra]ALU46122.1 hypothetical protein AT705_24480 [Pseudoalteromonas rubra]